MPRSDINSGDQRVPLRTALIPSQHMLQCSCQLMAMQGDYTVIVIACCDDHRRILLAAFGGRLHIVYWAVGVDIGKVLSLIWVAIVTGPCMPCIQPDALHKHTAYCA